MRTVATAAAVGGCTATTVLVREGGGLLGLPPVAIAPSLLHLLIGFLLLFCAVSAMVTVTFFLPRLLALARPPSPSTLATPFSIVIIIIFHFFLFPSVAIVTATVMPLLRSCARTASTA